MENLQIKKDLRRAANTSGITLILFYLLSIAVSILLPLLLKWFLPMESTAFEDVYKLLAYLIQYPVIISGLLLIFRQLCGKKLGLHLRDCFRKPEVSLWQLMKLLLICCGIVYASSYLSAFVNSILTMVVKMLTGFDLIQPEMAADNTFLSGFTNILAIIGFAPIFEELLFRGSMFRSMERGGQWPAAFMCAILFGLWHANYVQTFYTAVMGLCACFLAAKTGSVLSAILLHLCINTIGGIQSLVVGQIDIEALSTAVTTEDFVACILEAPMAYAIVLLMGCLILTLMMAGAIFLILELVIHPETFRLKKSDAGISGGRAFLCMLTSPWMLIACLLLLAMTVLRAVGLW